MALLHSPGWLPHFDTELFSALNQALGSHRSLLLSPHFPFLFHGEEATLASSPSPSAFLSPSCHEADKKFCKTHHRRYRGTAREGSASVFLPISRKIETINFLPLQSPPPLSSDLCFICCTNMSLEASRNLSQSPSV